MHSKGLTLYNIKGRGMNRIARPPKREFPGPIFSLRNSARAYHSESTPNLRTKVSVFP